MKEFRDGETVFHQGGPAEGVHPPAVLSFHPTETLIHYHFTLTVFFFFFYVVAAAFSPFFSVHSLPLPTLLLSGTACLRVRVRRSLPGTTLTLFHAFTQEELQPLLFVLLSS